jgi:hypothetical protein
MRCLSVTPGPIPMAKDAIWTVGIPQSLASDLLYNEVRHRVNIRIWWPSKLAVTVRLLICTRELLGSNPDGFTDYVDRDISWFTLVPLDQICTRILHECIALCKCAYYIDEPAPPTIPYQAESVPLPLSNSSGPTLISYMPGRAVMH